MSRFMRMLVFFDLPVQTKKQRREATAFRNFLIKDGYHMLQYSVYARVCNGNDAVAKHRARLTGQLPANGAVRLLVVTEKQYQSIEILLGPFSPADTSFACEAYAVLIFGKNKKRFRPQPEALFATVYYTIPRTVRELQREK